MTSSQTPEHTRETRSEVPAPVRFATLLSIVLFLFQGIGLPIVAIMALVQEPSTAFIFPIVYGFVLAIALIVCIPALLRRAKWARPTLIGVLIVFALSGVYRTILDPSLGSTFMLAACAGIAALLLTKPARAWSSSVD